MNAIPTLPPIILATKDGRRRLGVVLGWLRSWYAKTPVLRASLLVFLIMGVLIAAVVYTLDRNAQRSSEQQASTVLAGGSHVAASSFSALRANLRANAGQIAASLDLQRAVIARDQPALQRIALAQHAHIVVRGRAFGVLPSAPRIASTAIIASNGLALARVTLGISLADPALLQVIRDQTPLPAEAALVLVRNGRVIAGGPRNAPAQILNGRVEFGSITFAAQATPVGLPHTLVVAVEPLRAIQVGAEPYRLRLLLAALVTLVLAAALATRLGRPAARLFVDVSHLTRQAQTDELTGLANRRSLDERLREEIARAKRFRTKVAYVIADIDNFKLVNDAHGHKTGDEVLRAVSRALDETVRELDLAARYGGEEFALILPGTELIDARRIVERIRRTIAEIVVEGPGGVPVSVTASFGIAEFPTFATVDSLMEAADSVLYAAKRGGKNRVVAETGLRLKAPAV